MANSISDGTTTYYFFSLTGAINSLAMTLVDESRPGADGSVYRKIAKKAKPSTIETVCHVDTYAAAQTAIALFSSTMPAAIGTIVQGGVTWTPFLILDVENEEPEAVLNIRRGVYPLTGTAKNGSGFLVRTRWSVIYASDS